MIKTNMIYFTHLLHAIKKNNKQTSQKFFLNANKSPMSCDLTYLPEEFQGFEFVLSHNIHVTPL